MSESLSYPEREHIDPITTVLDGLRFELSVHENGAEFRKGIVTISRLYKHTDFLRSLQQLSRMMDLAHVIAGRSDKQPGIDGDFYRGTILALHATLRSTTTPARQAILAYDVFGKFQNEAGSYMINEDSRMIIVKALNDWRTGGFDRQLEQCDDEYQDLIRQSAHKMYEGVFPMDTTANKQSFISGYLMAEDMLVSLSGSVMEAPSHVVAPLV